MNNLMKHIRFIVSLSFCIINSLIYAQERRVLTFDKYLDNVKNSNIDYLAEQYNVDIADANVKAAKVFPDPELSVSYANSQNWDLRMGYGIDAELSYTLELGGKRKARIRVAQSEKEMTLALLEDYFRNLQAEATIAYMEVIKQNELYKIQKESYTQMLELARADSLRFQSGIIPETDARQSKLEAAIMLNEVYSSERDLQEALARLLLFQGDVTTELPDSIVGTLSCLKREFDLSSLVVTAQNNRADLQAMLKSKEISQNNLRLAKANRAIDLGISVGGVYSSEVLNEIAPAPAFKGFTTGISIPLKFSNTNKGELRAAQLAVVQSEKQYEAIDLQISSEVMQSYNKYVISCRKVEQFNTTLLHEAETILQKKIYSYERGEIGILEVLDARRTYNDIQINFNEILFESTADLVELERACGIWDIRMD